LKGNNFDPGTNMKLYFVKGHNPNKPISFGFFFVRFFCHNFCILRFDFFWNTSWGRNIRCVKQLDDISDAFNSNIICSLERWQMWLYAIGLIFEIIA
jgi:hypothetical protein